MPKEFTAKTVAEVREAFRDLWIETQRDTRAILARARAEVTAVRPGDVRDADGQVAATLETLRVNRHPADPVFVLHVRMVGDRQRSGSLFARALAVQDATLRPGGPGDFYARFYPRDAVFFGSSLPAIGAGLGSDDPAPVGMPKLAVLHRYRWGQQPRG
jgi:hypothetical protein